MLHQYRPNQWWFWDLGEAAHLVSELSINARHASHCHLVAFKVWANVLSQPALGALGSGGALVGRVSSFWIAAAAAASRSSVGNVFCFGFRTFFASSVFRLPPK